MVEITIIAKDIRKQISSILKSYQNIRNSAFGMLVALIIIATILGLASTPAAVILPMILFGFIFARYLTYMKAERLFETMLELSDIKLVLTSNIILSQQTLNASLKLCKKLNDLTVEEIQQKGENK